MFISELLSRKKYLDSKLLDIDNYIKKLSDLPVQGKSDIYNKAIEEKFALLTKIQSHKVLLQEQNSENTVDIAGNNITVTDAIRLRDTLLAKINTLSVLISDGDFTVISVFGLMTQRDALFEEYMVFNNALSESDIVNSWNKK